MLSPKLNNAHLQTENNDEVTSSVFHGEPNQPAVETSIHATLAGSSHEAPINRPATSRPRGSITLQSQISSDSHILRHRSPTRSQTRDACSPPISNSVSAGGLVDTDDAIHNSVYHSSSSDYTPRRLNPDIGNLPYVTTPQLHRTDSYPILVDTDDALQNTAYQFNNNQGHALHDIGPGGLLYITEPHLHRTDSYPTILVDTDDALQSTAYQFNNNQGDTIHDISPGSIAYATEPQSHRAGSGNYPRILVDTDDALQNTAYQLPTRHDYSTTGNLIHAVDQANVANNLPFQMRPTNSLPYASPLVDTDDAMRNTNYQAYGYSLMGSSPDLAYTSRIHFPNEYQSVSHVDNISDPQSARRSPRCVSYVDAGASNIAFERYMYTGYPYQVMNHGTVEAI